MSKYYRKVMCNDSLPKEHKVYSTNKGDMLFVLKDKKFGTRLYGGVIIEYPEWWFEEIEIPSEENKQAIVKEWYNDQQFKSNYPAEPSSFMAGLNKAIALIKGQ